MKKAFEQEQELSLRDLYLIVKHYRRSLLITPIVFALGAFLFAAILISPKYKASAIIEIGRLSNTQLESVVNLAERMKDDSFALFVVEGHKEVFTNGSNDVKLIFAEQGKLKADLVVMNSMSTERLGFSITAHTRERALAKATAVVASVQAIHMVTFQEGLNTIKRKMEIIDTIVSLGQYDIEKFLGNHGKVENPSIELANSILRDSYSEYIRELFNNKLELEADLSPTVTFNTKLLSKIFVSESPVSPNVRLITLMALLLGLFMAVVVVFVRTELDKTGPSGSC